MSNEAKMAIVFGSFLISAAIFAVIMSVAFPKVSSLIGVPVGMLLAVPYFGWYYMWKD